MQTEAGREELGALNWGELTEQEKHKIATEAGYNYVIA